jgi:hypothetical protein
MSRGAGRTGRSLINCADAAVRVAVRNDPSGTRPAALIHGFHDGPSVEVSGRVQMVG